MADKTKDTWYTLPQLAKATQLTTRTVQRYFKKLKDNDEHRYHEITTEEARETSGRPKLLYRVADSIKFVDQCRNEGLYAQMKFLEGDMASGKPKEDPKDLESPGLVLVKERIREKEQHAAPLNRVFLNDLTHAEQENFVRLICDRYQDNEASLRTCCYEVGVKIVDFMKTVVRNPGFMRIYEDSNTVRKHVLLAELEYWEEARILDKLKTKETKTTSVISEMAPEFDQEGNMAMVPIEKAMNVTTRPYYPTPMIIALANTKTEHLRSKLMERMDIPTPDFRNMTSAQRLEKIKELKLMLEDKQRTKNGKEL